MFVVKSKQASDDTSYVEIVVAMETKSVISNYLQSPSMIRELYTKYKTAHACLIKLEKAMRDKTKVEAKLMSRCKEKIIELREKDKVIKKLEQENEQLKTSLKRENQLQTKVALLEGRLKDGSRDSFLQFLTSLLATLLLGFGVNVVTTTPDNWMTWILIVMSITLSVFAFTLVRKNKK